MPLATDHIVWEEATRAHLVSLGLKLQGVPYIWGGDKPWTGLDCSGFIVWVAQALNVMPSGDWSAAMLYDTFTQRERPFVPSGSNLKPGDMVFYGMGTVSHVMMYIGLLNGAPMVVGASGGNSTTTTIAEAQRRGAMVKIKPITYRSDLIGACDILTPNKLT